MMTMKFLGVRWASWAAVVVGLGWASWTSNADPDVNALAREVADQGWIVYAARTAQGDYDLFISRPNGSGRRNLTQTPEWSEFGGRFSPDGTRLMYRRGPRGGEIRPGAGINHDVWGAQGSLCIAKVDGWEVEVLGGDGEWPWASWGPDGTQMACLHRREGRIRIVDIATKRVVREIPRQGIFQQMYWSPDGRRVCGTANVIGQDWNVVALELATGRVTLLSRVVNCTADWFQGDANRVIYSHRTPGLADAYGWTMLMQATADGASRSLIYAERGRHVYYGCTSPDDRYVIFSVPETDGGTDAPMAIVRLADTPIVVPEDYWQVRALYPTARSGPVLRLAQPGFEPDWSSIELGGYR
jgi:hypothetical protein